MSKGRLLLSVGFLIVLAVSLIRGEFVIAAASVFGLAWAFESYRWYKKKVE